MYINEINFEALDNFEEFINLKTNEILITDYDGKEKWIPIENQHQVLDVLYDKLVKAVLHDENKIDGSVDPEIEQFYYNIANLPKIKKEEEFLKKIKSYQEKINYVLDQSIRHRFNKNDFRFLLLKNSYYLYWLTIKKEGVINKEFMDYIAQDLENLSPKEAKSKGFELKWYYWYKTDPKNWEKKLNEYKEIRKTKSAESRGFYMDEGLHLHKNSEVFISNGRYNSYIKGSYLASLTKGKNKQESIEYIKTILFSLIAYHVEFRVQGFDKKLAHSKNKKSLELSAHKEDNGFVEMLSSYIRKLYPKTVDKDLSNYLKDQLQLYDSFPEDTKKLINNILKQYKEENILSKEEKKEDAYSFIKKLFSDIEDSVVKSYEDVPIEIKKIAENTKRSLLNDITEYAKIHKEKGFLTEVELKDLKEKISLFASYGSFSFPMFQEGFYNKFDLRDKANEGVNFAAYNVVKGEDIKALAYIASNIKFYRKVEDKNDWSTKKLSTDKKADILNILPNLNIMRFMLSLRAVNPNHIFTINDYERKDYYKEILDIYKSVLGIIEQNMTISEQNKDANFNYYGAYNDFNSIVEVMAHSVLFLSNTSRDFDVFMDFTESHINENWIYKDKDKNKFLNRPTVKAFEYLRKILSKYDEREYIKRIDKMKDNLNEDEDYEYENDKLMAGFFANSDPIDSLDLFLSRYSNAEYGDNSLQDKVKNKITRLIEEEVIPGSKVIIEKQSENESDENFTQDILEKGRNLLDKTDIVSKVESIFYFYFAFLEYKIKICSPEELKQIEKLASVLNMVKMKKQNEEQKQKGDV